MNNDRTENPDEKGNLSEQSEMAGRHRPEKRQVQKTQYRAKSFEREEERKALNIKKIPKFEAQRWQLGPEVGGATAGRRVQPEQAMDQTRETEQLLLGE